MGSTRGPASADHVPRVAGTLVQPGWEKRSPLMVPERQACTSAHTPLVEDTCHWILAAQNPFLLLLVIVLRFSFWEQPLPWCSNLE